MRKFLIILFYVVFFAGCGALDATYDVYSQSEDEQLAYFDSDARLDKVFSEIDNNFSIMRLALEQNEFEENLGMLGNFSIFTNEETSELERIILKMTTEKLSSSDVSSIRSFLTRVTDRIGGKLPKIESNFTFATLRLKTLFFEEFAISGVLTWDHQELYPTSAYNFLLENLYEMYFFDGIKDEIIELYDILQALAERKTIFTHKDGSSEQLSRDILIDMINSEEQFKTNIDELESIFGEFVL